MIGSIFALLSAACFASGKVFIRRAVLKIPDASLGILISVPMAAPLFFLILVFSGQLHTLMSFSWRGYVWLSLAGIVHFIVGRSLNYKCTQLVGANIGNILSRADIPVSVIFGVSFLSEPLSWPLAGGVSFILVGIILAGMNTQMLQNAYGEFSRVPFMGYIYGFGCGLAWGISPIFVKLGLEGSGSSVAGAFISFLAASVVLALTLLNRKRRTAFVNMGKKTAGLFFLAGGFSCTANLFRYIALGFAPASVVTPLVSIQPVFGLIFAFMFNRKIEIFSRPVIIGTIAVVIGTLMII